MSTKSNNGGYVVYIAVLIITVVLVALFMKTFFLPSPIPASEFQPKNAGGIVPATEFERLRADMGAADAVTKELNKKALETNAILNSAQ